MKTSMDSEDINDTDSELDTSPLNANVTNSCDRKSKDVDIHVETKTSADSARLIPPNGGYGWVIVFASFVTLFLADGFLFSFGVLLVALIEDLDESTASVAALGGILNGCLGISALLAGSLIDVIGKRNVTIIGSALFSGGLLLSRFATNIGWLYLLYGIFGGVGFGFMVTPPLASAMEHFTTKRPLVSGIALCGSGFGVFVMTITTSYLLGRYGWQGSLLILSALMMHGLPCGLAIPRERWKMKRQQTQDTINVETSHKTSVISTMGRVNRQLYSLVWENNLSILRNFKCLCILLSAFFFGLGSFVPFSYLPKQAISVGMQKQKASLIVSLSGISNALGRIGVGWIGSRGLANHKIKLAALILFVDAASFPLSLFMTSFGAKLAYSIVYGSLYGAMIVSYPVMLAESVLEEKLDKAVGLPILMYCTGGLIGVPVAGWTVDITGDFAVCYILAGVQTFIAAIFLMIPSIRDYVA